MRKLVPILALTLCAFLLLSLATAPPAAAYSHEVGDRLDYEIRADLLIKYAAGPPDDDFDIEIDLSHVLQNASGDMHYANLTFTWLGPQDYFGPYTGESNWTAVAHNFMTGYIPQMWSINPDDWSEMLPYWYSDIFYVAPGLEPGDSVQFGYSDMVGPPGTTWYENNTYFLVGIPVMAGPIFSVGASQLNTIKIGMDYLYYSNSTMFPSDYQWDVTSSFEMIWEWSMGFLCQINFDYYVNSRPYNEWDMTEMWISGNMTLVDYDLTNAPVPYYGGVPPPSPLPIIIAAVAVVIIIVIIIIFLIWRSRKGK